MPGWTDLKSLIDEEGRQLIEQGAVPAAVAEATAEGHRRLAGAANEWAVWEAFKNVPHRTDFPFNEPSDLPSIQKLRKRVVHQQHSVDLIDDRFADQMHGAWLGRCVGCALGKPVERFMESHNGMQSWARQKKYLTAVSESEWPLKDYIPLHSPAEAEAGKVGSSQSTRDHIAFMETDDDIRYTVLGQVIMQRHGANFTSAHVAHAWFEMLGYQSVCTAETQAYRNMVMGGDQFRWWVEPANVAEIDAAADWHTIVHHLNPYREWIGAQIRIDSYGYAAPGNPQLAAEFAFRDARISHVKNGIYGAMFCSAMIAAAFATNDVQSIVQAGLAEIPETSRLFAEMQQVIQICHRHNNDFSRLEAVLADIYALLGHYNPVHTNNNAGICVAALLLSGGDFHKGITLAVMGGWDTDCNGATVGSIVGAITGGRRAPQHWTARLNDTLNSLIPGYHPIAISQCARQSVEIARQVARELGSAG